VLQGGGSIIFSGVQQMQGSIFGAINVTLAGGTTTFESTASSNPNGLFLKGGRNVIAAGGTVTVGVQNVNFQGSASPAIILNSGATPAVLKLNGNVTVSGNTTGVAQIQNGIGGAVPGTVHLGGAVRTFTVSDGASSPDLLINARVISGGILKSGNGMLALTGTNGYAGGTTLTDGTLQINNASALGTGSVVFSGGTLDIRSDAATTNLNNVIGVASTSTSINLNIDRINPGPAGTFLLGAATLGGNLNVSGGGTLQLNVATLTNNLNINGEAAVVINAPLGGFFGLSRGDGVTSGTLTLGGAAANTFIGTTTLNSGVLQLNKTSGNAIPLFLTILGGTVRELNSNQIVDNGIVTVSNPGSTFELNNTSDIIGQLTTDPNGLVIGSGTISTSSGGTDNKGAITANGGTLRINNSIVQVTGNILTGGTWGAQTNSTLTLGDVGTITENDATISLSGPGSNFSNLSLQTNAGTLLLQNGRVYSVNSPLLSSGLIQMDASSSLVLANAPLELQNGRIVGGTVSATGNGTLVISQNYTGTLDGVTLATDLSVGSAALNLYNGLTLNSKLSLGTGVLHGHNGNLYVYGESPTITGAGHEILMNPGQLDVRHNGTMTFASGLLVHGVGSIYGYYGNNGLLNQGTIQSDVAGQTLSIYYIRLDLINNGTISAMNGSRLDLSNNNTSIINNGTMLASGGSELDVGSNVGSFTNNGTISSTGATLALYGNWHNAGTINTTNSAVYLGGSFVQSDLGNFIHTGGSINLIGTINNGLNLTSATGPWNLSGGTISGGSVTFSGAGSLQVGSGGFDSVTLNSDLTIPANAQANIFNGLTLNAKLTSQSNSTLYFYGESPTVTGVGHEILLSSGNFDLRHNGTMSFGSGLLVHGVGSIYGYGNNGLLNQGTIQADVIGQTLSVNNIRLDLINNGTISAMNGSRLDLSNNNTSIINNGTMIAANESEVDLGSSNGAFVNNGTISVGHLGLGYIQGAFTNSGTIDNGGEIVIDYPNPPATSPLSVVRQQLQTGFANGAWNGPGINSSAAALSHKTAIAYLDTAAHPGAVSIFGFTLDPTSVLLEYTLAGDANIDGRVNSLDFNEIAANFNTSGHEWLEGDFNYDGKVNALDFNAVAANYGGFMLFIPSSPLAASPAALGSLVPEPSTPIAFLGLAALHARRRRR
jgi:autotransporter-associated beta strand protein